MSDHSSTQIYAERRPPAGPDEPIVVTRLLDAPRDLVFRAWTEPERLKRWWGPRGFTAPVIETDPRVGGRYLWGMRSPDGQETFTTGVFREIVEPERFVVTESFATADGTVVPASHYGLPGDWPAAIVMTVALEERDGRTAMTVREEGTPAEARALSEEGLQQCVDRLAEYLATTRAQGGSIPDEASAGLQPPAPDPRLRRLDPYVGTWSLQGKETREYGEVRGTLTFEWMEGGYFLLQHVDIDHAGQPVQGIEVIGYGRDWEGNAPADCTSHFFDNTGNHFVYIYDIGDDGAVTIWGGYVGSPAAFRGRFSEDKKTITGRWDWPGGGYDAIITRVG